MLNTILDRQTYREMLCLIYCDSVLFVALISRFIGINVQIIIVEHYII